MFLVGKIAIAQDAITFTASKANGLPPSDREVSGARFGTLELLDVAYLIALISIPGFRRPFLGLAESAISSPCYQIVAIRGAVVRFNEGNFGFHGRIAISTKQFIGNIPGCRN